MELFVTFHALYFNKNEILGLSASKEHGINYSPKSNILVFLSWLMEIVLLQNLQNILKI